MPMGGRSMARLVPTASVCGKAKRKKSGGRGYKGKRKVAGMEVFAGEKAFKRFNRWRPVGAGAGFQECRVGIEGPVRTPVGGGSRWLNGALRQRLGLCVGQGPVRWCTGVP